MKRYLILILIAGLALASGLWVGCSLGSGSASLTTYTNTTYGYSIEYPSSWKLDESGETVRIYSPLNEHISIGVMETEGVTTEDFEWLVENMTEGLPTEISEFQLISKAQLYEMSYPTWEIVWTGKTNEGLAVKAKTRCIGYKDKVYVITAGVLGSDLPSSLNDALNSFTFQNQAGEELGDYLTYLDKILPLGEEYLQAISAVLDADMATYKAIQARNEQAFFEALTKELDIQNRALNLVNSDILFLESIIPPAEAQTLHNLMIESLQTAQTGLVKLSYGDTIIYEKLYSRLFSSSPSKEYPDTSEEMRQGRQLIGEALNIWEQVGIEVDNLLQILEQKTKT